MFSKPKERNITVWPDLRLNFWGITKCGNSSVKNHLYSLQNESADFDKDVNINSSKYVKYISMHEALNNGYDNFTVVRNPYDRFKSMYSDLFHKRPARGIKAGINVDWNVDQFLDFLESKKENELDVHFLKQSTFINPSLMQYIVKLEDMSSWDLSIPPPKVRSHQSGSNELTLTSEQKNRVYFIYKKDFEVFSY